MFGYGNFVMMIELHLSPAKSIPREHFVVNKMSSCFAANSSIAEFPFFWISRSLSCVIMLSNISFEFSSSLGRSLKAETWTSVGGVARESCMSRIFRYRDLVIVLFLKFEKEQFSSVPVFFIWTVPGFLDSACMILKSFNPNISFRTCSEWRVPDIMTRTLFCSISSESFCARLIETIVMIIGFSLFLEVCPKSPDWD